MNSGMTFEDSYRVGLEQSRFIKDISLEVAGILARFYKMFSDEKAFKVMPFPMISVMPFSMISRESRDMFTGEIVRVVMISEPYGHRASKEHQKVQTLFEYEMVAKSYPLIIRTQLLDEDYIIESKEDLENFLHDFLRSPRSGHLFQEAKSIHELKPYAKSKGLFSLFSK
jgi:hypothetical protein